MCHFTGYSDLSKILNTTITQCGPQHLAIRFEADDVGEVPPFVYFSLICKFQDGNCVGFLHVVVGCIYVLCICALYKVYCILCILPGDGSGLAGGGWRGGWVILACIYVL